MTQKFDAIVIGAGQAGPALAGRLVQAGMTVAIVERSAFGGTCVNTGCTPTKALVASAEVAHVARRAAEYGISISGTISADIGAIKNRMHAIVAKSRDGLEQWLRSLKGCAVVKGHARFESANVVRVGDQHLSAPRIFINVGARANIPEMPGVREIPVLTNSTLIGLDVLPSHLVIVGGGPVGVEFAQMYRRFGSVVTLIEQGPALLGHEDREVSEAVAQILTAEGVVVRLNARCIRFSKGTTGVVANTVCTEGAPDIAGSHVLVAVGRRPNTDTLGLEHAGVEVDARGFIVVDDALATSTPGIWALGECNGRGAFTHTSYNDFQIVADNLLNNDTRRVTDRITCYGVFIDPPLGRVGLTETQAIAKGYKLRVARRAMTRVNRAVEKGETQGFMKVLVEQGTDRIVGASILGVGGDEAVHAFVDTMAANVTYRTLERAVHIHPTVAELIPTLLSDIPPTAGADALSKT